MIHPKHYLAAVLFALTFQACREKPEDPVMPEPAKATIAFDARWAGQPFQMQHVYLDDFGNRLRADKFMNYISLVTLIKDDGTEVLVKDFLLLDFFNANSVTAEIPEGNYIGLKFGVGVPRDNNKDQDPAQYPSSSPLSVAGSQGMFWTWNTGYIFAKFEGKCDTTGTEGTELLTPVAIHTGDDFSYREYNSPPFSLDLKPGMHTFNVHLNVDQIFSPVNGNDVNIALDAITHGSTNPDLTNNFMDNYLAALSFEP